MIRLGINVPNFGPQTDARALLSWTRFAESHGWLEHSGLPALRRESQRAGASMPGIVPRIKFRPAAAPVADPDRPLGAGTITQITTDIQFLAGLGADLIILDPNPDTPRPRDYAFEKNGLLAVRAALTSHA